jgi:putative ABC transport system ATP-binding protein
MHKEDKEKTAQLRRDGLSVVFQDLRIFPVLNGWENLEVKRILTGTETAERAEAWMDRLGIGDKKVASGRTLSYGEQQRLAIVRSLLQPFRWLLMDEPFSHLDKENMRRAAALIAEVVEERGASLLLADLDANDYFPYTQTLTL